MLPRDVTLLQRMGGSGTAQFLPWFFGLVFFFALEMVIDECAGDFLLHRFTTRDVQRKKQQNRGQKRQLQKKEMAKGNYNDPIDIAPRCIL